MAREIVLPIENTIFGLLKEKEQKGRKNRIQTFFFMLVLKWPNNKELKQKIEQFWEENKKQIETFDDNTLYEDWLTFLNDFNHRNNLKRIIKAEAQATINELSKPNTNDSPILKDLKEIARGQEHQETIDALFEDAIGGVFWIVFVVDALKSFYFNYLPTFINNELNKTPIVTLNELDVNEWKKIRNGIYTSFYGASFRVETENDLEDLRSELRDKLNNLEKIINDVGDKKEVINQQGEKSKYLNKFLAIYKAQITEQTTNFYLNELRLDESDDIRPEYKGVDYLTLLDKLTGDSELDNVINAFKIVALICAVKKAQKKSNEYYDPNTKKPLKVLNKNIKHGIFKGFESIKVFYDENADLAPTEKDNPLYLPIIREKQAYKTQLENIIQLWQK